MEITSKYTCSASPSVLSTEQREFIRKIKCIHRFIVENKVLFDYLNLHIEGVRGIKHGKGHPLNGKYDIISSMLAIYKYINECCGRGSCNVVNLFYNCIYDGLIRSNDKTMGIYLNLVDKLKVYSNEG